MNTNDKIKDDRKKKFDDNDYDVQYLYFRVEMQPHVRSIILVELSV